MSSVLYKKSVTLQSGKTVHHSKEVTRNVESSFSATIDLSAFPPFVIARLVCGWKDNRSVTYQNTHGEPCLAEEAVTSTAILYNQDKPVAIVHGDIFFPQANEVVIFSDSSESLAANVFALNKLLQLYFEEFQETQTENWLKQLRHASHHQPKRPSFPSSHRSIPLM